MSNTCLARVQVSCAEAARSPHGSPRYTTGLAGAFGGLRLRLSPLRFLRCWPWAPGQGTQAAVVKACPAGNTQETAYRLRRRSPAKKFKLAGG
jgi:hypothetical protein